MCYLGTWHPKFEIIVQRVFICNRKNCQTLCVVNSNVVRKKSDIIRIIYCITVFIRLLYYYKLHVQQYFAKIFVTQNSSFSTAKSKILRRQEAVVFAKQKQFIFRRNQTTRRVKNYLKRRSYRLSVDRIETPIWVVMW